MKKTLLSLASLFFLNWGIDAQEIKFEEYDLPNGLHVILHQDNSAPVVTTSVMYHVGAKDEAEEQALLLTTNELCGSFQILIILLVFIQMILWINFFIALNF